MDETRLPLTEHLAELRGRLIRSIVAWGIGIGVSWTYKEEIFRYLLRPAVAALGTKGHLQASCSRCR